LKNTIVNIQLIAKHLLVVCAAVAMFLSLSLSTVTIINIAAILSVCRN